MEKEAKILQHLTVDNTPTGKDVARFVEFFETEDVWTFPFNRPLYVLRFRWICGDATAFVSGDRIRRRYVLWHGVLNWRDE